MGVKPLERTVTLSLGTSGIYDGRAVEISAVIGPNKLLLLDRSTMDVFPGTASKFQVPEDRHAVAAPAIHEQSLDWSAAESRYEIIKPLVEGPSRRLSLEEVKERARIANVHFTTIYRWIRLFEAAGRVPSGLKPNRKVRGRRGKRLDIAVAAIMDATIAEIYKSDQQCTVASVHRELVQRCRAARLAPPQYNTLRRKIEALPDREKLASRANRKAAADIYDLRAGSVKVSRPWELVQIDGTPADVLLVDEEFRKPIGRAHITIAIDVYSRMILGFYVSLEAESASTAGLCLSNAMLPKESWLAHRGITGNWPCFGRPTTVHADNGLAFRSNMLHRVCGEYHINLTFRPLKTPQYGGHIEAFNKTLARKIHELPGSTFFDVQHRGEYPSESRASLTLEEFEKWLCEAVLEYHQKFHEGIQASPISRYNEAFVIRKQALPIATPEKFTDEKQLRIDFMPFVEQTVQQYGVQLWKVRYSHSILRPFVNSKSPGRYATKRTFRFHYDPRDVSHIFFYHPDLKQYFPIPYQNISNPKMSMWECTHANKELRKAGLNKIDEIEIIKHVRNRRQIESAAAKKSRVARRNAARVQSAERLPDLAIVDSSVPRLRLAQAQSDSRRVMRPYIVEDF